MQFLITLEETESGFSVQVPDLAILTFGVTIALARQAAIAAIQANLTTYHQIGKAIPNKKNVVTHLTNPDFQDLLFAFVNVNMPAEKKAA